MAVWIIAKIVNSFYDFFFLFLVKAYLIKYWDFENSSLTFETE